MPRLVSVILCVSRSQELDLSWNALGNRGACVLGAALRHNKALQRLDLTHNGIAEARRMAHVAWPTWCH